MLSLTTEDVAFGDIRILADAQDLDQVGIRQMHQLRAMFLCET